MSTCATCAAENADGQRFCGQCGTPLARACAACGAAAGPDQRFCGDCGTPLGETAAPAPAGPVTERRVCSVLFADLVGFTTLSEARDHEEVRELLSAYFETARTIIARYGGTVEKFIGDAVMAVWGTPVATEGDAERAVRAALDLVTAVAELGPGVSLRAGVVTGEVAATLGAVGQGMVAGDAVNTAARVQSAATPGTVWVDDATQRLAQLAIGFRDAGTHPLKGKAEPARLWEATRVLSGVGGSQRVDGLEAPMVGRSAEERTLRELFHAVLDRSTARVVTVTGPAGIGKSRLGWEFEKYVDGLAATVNWHRGRCLSYGDGVAYWALAEAVRQRFGIAEEDPAERALATFLTRLGELVPDPDERSFVGVRLGRLLGLAHPDDPGSDLERDDLFAGWRLFLERLAAEAPVVLLVEDAQHADEGLLDFLEHTVDWARAAPVFVVVFGRSELVERRPSLAHGRQRTTLTLDGLDDASMRTMVAALVRDLPEAAVTAIADQAQGNPLFAVETVRSLVDRDVVVPVGGVYTLVGEIGDLQVPDSLHGLLAARLDALDPDLRALVADAAVLGTTFPADALAAVSGREPGAVLADLGELVRRGVLEVSSDPLSPQRGQYAFAQGMLRTVAYETLSRRDRRTRHLAVAAHLESALGEEMMDVVARHYLDALAAGEDDPAIREHALASLVRAAERADRAGARARAGASYAEAADLSADPRAAARLLERAASSWIHGGRAEDGLGAAVRARVTMEELGDARAAAGSAAGQARALTRLGRLDEARVVVDAALPTLRVDPGEDTVHALNVAANAATLSGAATGRDLATEALDLAQSLPDIAPGLQAQVMTTSGTTAAIGGRRLEAVALLTHAAELARRADDVITETRALTNLSAVLLTHQPSGAEQPARASADLARRSGDPFGLDLALTNVAVALLQQGRWDEALDLRSELVEDADVLANLRMALAFIHLMRGESVAAQDVAAGARERLSGTDDLQDQAVVQWLDALTAEADGDPAASFAALRLVRDGGTDVDWEGHVWGWPLAVRAALALGDLAAVRALVTGLDDLIGRLPPTTRAAHALAHVALATAEGRHDATLTERAERAVAALREAGSPHHLAHGLLDHATYLRATGADATALVALVEEAAAIGERLGAADLGRRVVELQRVVV